MTLEMLARVSPCGYYLHMQQLSNLSNKMHKMPGQYILLFLKNNKHEFIIFMVKEIGAL
jgi:hypothetical protein